MADEQNNKADDNGNGLIEEGQLVQTDVATGDTVDLGGDLDLSLTQFVWDGSSMTITFASSYHRSEGYSYGGATATEEISRTWNITPRN